MKQIVGSYKTLVADKKLKVLVGNYPYLVVLVGKNAYMIPDECPHQDASLYEGSLDGEEVTCPLHRATFNVVTGEIDDVSKMLYFDFGPEKITTQKLEINGDQIIADL